MIKFTCRDRFNASRRTALLTITASASGLFLSEAVTANFRISTNTELSFPGGIIQLRWPKFSPQLPIVKFGLHDTTVLDDDDHWRCLIGISLKTLPGEYIAYIRHPDSGLPALSHPFLVRQKQYKFNDKPTPITPNNQPWHIKNLNELDFVNSVPPRLPMNFPTDGNWSDDFGAVVTYTTPTESTTSNALNRKNYLSLNTESTPMKLVLAPQNGIVCQLQNNSRLSADKQSRKMMVIDHGRGIYSAIDGLHQTTINVGDGILQGAVIGRIPSRTNTQVSATTSDSGIASPFTPPTLSSGLLHWQCIMNGAAIDPRILTELN